MKDPRIYIRHILESIDLVTAYLNGVSKADFLARVQLQDSVIRRLEVIGEAVRNIPKDFRSLHPELPWQEAAGMRDMLIHGYFEVDLEAVWATAQDDLPAFGQQLEELLAQLSDAES